MNQVFLWIAVILCILYGALTAFAAVGQLRAKQIQTWSAWGMILCGLLVIGSAMLLLFNFVFAFWELLLALVLIHLFAINNGYKLYGKINPSHHVARLLVSVILLGLTYLGIK